MASVRSAGRATAAVMPAVASAPGPTAAGAPATTVRPLPMAERALDEGKSVVLDNTYVSRESRKSLVDLGRRRNVPVRCVWLDASIEDAQVNAVMRMVRKYGAFLSPDEIKKASRKDPNAFGPSVLFRYRKGFEEPTTIEGFASVERVAFKRSPASPDYTQKALLLDYDGTLRRTKSGDKYPKTPDDIEILPNRRAVLARAGYAVVSQDVPFAQALR